MTLTARYAPRETFAQISGALALDLVNTVSWRASDERRIEHLGGYDDVRRWAEQLGVIDDDEARVLGARADAAPAEAAAEAARVVELREAIFAACFRGASAEPITAANAEAVTAGRLERAGDGAGADGNGGDDARWSWVFPVDLALPRRRIALAAVELLRRDDLGMLAQCSDAECGWVFLDHSPRHNRRWCVAADCGNRNRVRDYYARRQTRSAVDERSSTSRRVGR